MTTILIVIRLIRSVESLEYPHSWVETDPWTYPLTLPLLLSRPRPQNHNKYIILNPNHRVTAHQVDSLSQYTKLHPSRHPRPSQTRHNRVNSLALLHYSNESNPSNSRPIPPCQNTSPTHRVNSPEFLHFSTESNRSKSHHLSHINPTQANIRTIMWSGASPTT